MPDQQEVVKTIYGPCEKCGQSIEEPEKPVKYRDKLYHVKCVPTKKEEASRNNSSS